MPINSKNSTSPDLSALLEGLIQADVKFILVGGLAAVVQGAPITMMDVDIVHYQSCSGRDLVAVERRIGWSE